MKQTISFLLVLTLITAMTAAASAYSQEAETSADYLYCVGLFNGKGSDEYGNPIYDLDGSLTRQEAIAMIIRIMGLEKAASSGVWKHPFSDVDDWAEDYVGYAYAKGITKGISQTLYGAGDTVTCQQFVTFLLRALNYSDSEGDFTWEDPYVLSDELGLTKSSASKDGLFTRGDASVLSENCLSRVKKGTHQTLYRGLVCGGTIKPYDVIRLPSEKITIPIGSTVRLRVVQSDKKSDVSLYAQWDDVKTLGVEWTGQWVGNIRTEMLVTGEQKGSTKLTVTYEKGGSSYASATMYVVVE